MGGEGERKKFEGERQVGGEQGISLDRFGAGKVRRWGECWAVSALPLETGVCIAQEQDDMFALDAKFKGMYR